jgi:hypothetical protein
MIKALEVYHKVHQQRNPSMQKIFKPFDQNPNWEPQDGSNPSFWIENARTLYKLPGIQYYVISSSRCKIIKWTSELDMAWGCLNVEKLHLYHRHPRNCVSSIQDHRFPHLQVSSRHSYTATKPISLNLKAQQAPEAKETSVWPSQKFSIQNTTD